MRYISLTTIFKSSTDDIFWLYAVMPGYVAVSLAFSKPWLIVKVSYVYAQLNHANHANSAILYFIWVVFCPLPARSIRSSYCPRSWKIKILCGVCNEFLGMIEQHFHVTITQRDHHFSISSAQITKTVLPAHSWSFLILSKKLINLILKMSLHTYFVWIIPIWIKQTSPIDRSFWLNEKSNCKICSKLPILMLLKTYRDFCIRPSRYRQNLSRSCCSCWGLISTSNPENHSCAPGSECWWKHWFSARTSMKNSTPTSSLFRFITGADSHGKSKKLQADHIIEIAPSFVVEHWRIRLLFLMKVKPIERWKWFWRALATTVNLLLLVTSVNWSAKTRALWTDSCKKSSRIDDIEHLSFKNSHVVRHRLIKKSFLHTIRTSGHDPKALPPSQHRSGFLSYHGFKQVSLRLILKTSYMQLCNDKVIRHEQMTKICRLMTLIKFRQDVMIPRANMTLISIDQPVSEIRRLVADSTHSIPVLDRNIMVIGLVFAKFSDSSTKKSISTFCESSFIPE